MKRRGFIQSIIGGIAGFIGGKIMADEKPEPKYKTVKPNDDGWVELSMGMPGVSFQMRFKPQGNWDINNNERDVLIDYVRILQPRDHEEFIKQFNERNRNGENQTTAEEEAD